MEQGPWHPMTYVDWWPIFEDHRALNSMPCLGKAYEFWTFSITALGSRGHLSNSQGCIFPAGIELEFVSQVEYCNIGQCVFRTHQSVRLRRAFMLHAYGRKLLPRDISGGRQDWKVAVFHGEGQLFLVILVAVLLWKAWCESSFLPLQVFLAALSFSGCIPHSCPLVQFGHMNVSETITRCHGSAAREAPCSSGLTGVVPVHSSLFWFLHSLPHRTVLWAAPGRSLWRQRCWECSRQTRGQQGLETSYIVRPDPRPRESESCG